MSLRVVVLALVLWPAGVGAQQARDTLPAARDTAAPAAVGAEGHATRGPVRGADRLAGEPGRVQQFGQDFRLGFDVTLHTVEAPRHWSEGEWLAVPAAALALVTLSGADEPVHGFFDRNRSAGVDHVLTAIEPFGTKRGIATVVGTYLVGLALDVPSLRRTGVEAAASSIVASGIVTPALKLLVGRSRPWTARGAFDFHSMTGNESFPSGHTTQAFAAASVFAEEAHPLWAKVLIYGLAGGVATARMYHDAHFLSDVTAGATIGTVVGRSVVARAHDELRERGGLAPYVGSDGVGLELRF